MSVNDNPQELQDQLKVQLEFLKRSSERYDEGSSNEAIRLAAVARVLCHSTGSSHALLEQLGLLDTLMFVDTCQWPSDVSSEDEEGEPLQWIRFNFSAAPISGGPHGFNAQLGRASVKSLKRFADWWAAPVVADLTNKMTRKDVVLSLANKDGGAHVDTNRSEPYEAMSRQGTLGRVSWQTPSGSWVKTDVNPVLAVMRQIAHEVIETLQRLTGSQ